MMTTEFAGPVDYAVFVIPEHADPADGLFALLELADRGSIDLLDLEVVRADGQGGGIHLALQDCALTGLEAFIGADSGLLAEDDLAEVAADLGAGETALVVIYQDRTLAPVAQAFTKGGIRLQAVGGVDLTQLDAELGQE